MRRADPVDRAFNFATGSRAAGFALKIDTAPQLGHVACTVFHYLLALDDVGVFESHFTTGSQPKIFRRRRFHEIVAVDEKLATEWEYERSGIRVFRIIDC